MLSKALYDAVTELEENKHYFDKSFKYFVGNIMHIFPELLEHKPKGVTNYLWWHPKHRGARVRVLKAMINKTKN